MKITIRTNPEIIIEVDQDKTSPLIPITTGILGRPITPAREPRPDPEGARKLGGKIGKHKTRLCSNCNQLRHKKPTCPNEKKKDKKDSDPFDDDLAEKIQGLREEGFSSQYVADDLRIPLETVNRYW